MEDVGDKRVAEAEGSRGEGIGYRGVYVGVKVHPAPRPQLELGHDVWSQDDRKVLAVHYFLPYRNEDLAHRLQYSRTTIH